MRVEELVQKLVELDPEMEVYCNDREVGGVLVETLTVSNDRNMFDDYNGVELPALIISD